MVREYQRDGGAWQPMPDAIWTTAGSIYRFRATATDRAGNQAQTVTETTTVGEWPAPTPPPPPAEPTPTITPAPTITQPPTVPISPVPSPQPTRIPSTVRIAKATLRDGMVTAAGTRTRGATGRVLITFSARIGGRTRKVSKRVIVSRGRWTARIKLSGTLHAARTGRLTVTYGGDRRHRPAQAASMRLRRR